MSTLVDSTTALADAYQREARDLRVSLTDRCNLRCTYCLPEDGVAWLPSRELLTDEEVLRLVRLAVNSLGVRRIRFTGGEPLLRPGLLEIIKATARLRTDRGLAPEISLTTNGIGLERRAASLAAAGLTRVNVSLDSLDPARYQKLARRACLDEVLRGLEAAKAAGLGPVKVNTVVMRGVNEADILPLAEFCLQHGYPIRFIEQMPLGAARDWQRVDMVPAAEILTTLRAHLSLSPIADRGSAPAQEWLVAEGRCHPAGRVGVIPSVTAPFCATCDRTRITADGQLRSCLFANSETDLRTPLRAGVTDSELAELWLGAHQAKQAGHGIGTAGFQAPDRGMSAIGG